MMHEAELQILRRAFESHAPIPDTEWERAKLGARVIDVDRGAPLLRQGERVDWLGFLARGLLRIHRNAGEREVTLGFDCEERFVGAFDAYSTRTCARYSLEALEPSRVIAFDRPWLDAALERDSCWREVFRGIVAHDLVHKIDKELRIRTASAEERYRELLRKDSYLVRRVPLYHLASFLGIAPETLSRIRARIGRSSART